MADYTSVQLDGPRLEHKRAITVAGIRRQHQKKGFDFAELPHQAQEMTQKLPGPAARVGDRVFDIFWSMFDNADHFDYLVGVEISDDTELPEGFTSLPLPAQLYATVPCHPGGDPRDTVYTLWHEWLPASGAVHPGADAPEFIYEHDQNYREGEKNGTVDIYIPVSSRTIAADESTIGGAK